MTPDRLVFSVMGPHAHEDVSSIFRRKISDISIAGETLWLCRSPNARPDRTQNFFSTCEDCQILFLAPTSKNGARPTSSAQPMIERSPNRIDWSPIEKTISPVTGHADRGAYAFVLTALSVYAEPTMIDLWQYAEEPGLTPVRFRLGASTLLARRHATSTHELRPKTRFRQVIASGRLSKPYAVWVR